MSLTKSLIRNHKSSLEYQSNIDQYNQIKTVTRRSKNIELKQ